MASGGEEEEGQEEQWGSSGSGSGGGGGGGHKKKSRRLGLDDFNYTFVGYEPPPPPSASSSGGPVRKKEDGKKSADEAEKKAESAAAEGEGGGGGGDDGKKDSAAPPSAADAGDKLRSDDDDEEDEPYVYQLPRRYRRRHGDDDDIYVSGGGGGGPAGDPTAAISSGLGALCCCLTAAFIIAGGVLVAYYNAYDKGQEGGSDGRHLFAGAVCFVFAAASCLCGCCSLFVGCISAAAGPFGGGGGGEGNHGGGGGGSSDPKEVRLRLRRLNGRVSNGEDALEYARLDVTCDLEDVKKARKKEIKDRKEKEKKEREELEERVKKDLERGMSTKDIRKNYRPVCFYFTFDGDTSRSGMDLLRKQVSLVVHQGRRGVDEAVVVVTSPGGEVSSYGLAASQLVRVRKSGVKLIVCVDSIAASGGYMMASVADVICAAPFALVGSIGVLAQIPNFHRFLERHDVDAYTFTAGRYKRTVDPLSEVTEEGKAKFREELEDIHVAFKDHVSLARPKQLGDESAIEAVSTGEAWLAVQAKERGLVDEIMTSDEYVDGVRERGYDVIEIVQRKVRHTGLYGALGDVPGINLAESIKGVVDGLRSSAEKPRPSYTPMAIS